MKKTQKKTGIKNHVQPIKREEMTTPLTLICENSTEIPSVEQICKMVLPGRHLVMRFPADKVGDKTSIVAKLASSMPEYSIFDSGGDSDFQRITVMAVVDSATVLSHEKFIKEAMELYIQTCSALVTQMTNENLPEIWSSDVHGNHCRFENAVTKQVVEAPLMFPLEPRTADPFFFAQFVKSTLSCEAVANLIRHDYHDAARLLKIVFGERKRPNFDALTHHS